MAGGPQVYTKTSEDVLALLVELEDRPYDFVMAMFPWGEPGELAARVGPEPWQERVLRDLQARMLAPGNWSDADKSVWIGRALLIAIKSGKNVGKTALLSWLTWWAFATKVNTKGRATANTKTQLESVMWTELRKWHRLSLFGDFFTVTATKLYATDPKYSGEWHFDAVPWSADNPDAWSGLHNQDGRVLQVFDEASGIDDVIWERADGATREARTQVIWIACSNPTTNVGRFYECFHKFAPLWLQFTVDSREVSLTDHEAIEEAIRLWGVDSDYTKMSFLGEFPSASFSQLIPAEAIRYARTCEVSSQPWESLILGVDPARFGDNESVAYFRRGRDARTMPPIRRRGLSGPECADWVANLISQHGPDATFVDSGGLGGPVVDLLQRMGHGVIGINFGSPPGSAPQGQAVLNKRAEMYVLLRDWLRSGGCVVDDDTLETQLLSIDYKIVEKLKNTPLQLLSKEDMRRMGRPSPDIADAIALTFAQPVSARAWRGRSQIKVDYDPLAADRLPQTPNAATARLASYDPFAALERMH